MLDRPGGLSAFYIYVLYYIYELHWFGVLLCKASMVNRWGAYLPLVSVCFLYALVFPYIFLSVDCFKWALIDGIEKQRVHSVLWQFWMGWSIYLWYLYVFYMHWYFLIFSYKLTVLNGLSLTTLKIKKFTLCSGSFKWGGLSAWALHLPNLNSRTFRCAHQ